ncbi:MAG: glycosyltransferase [Phycisphaerae bacterium]
MDREALHGGTGNYQNLGDVIAWIRAIDPRSVLDIGTGFGRWGFLVRDFLEIWNGRNHRDRWQVRLIGVEAFEHNVREHHALLYNEVYRGPAERFLAERADSFELVILGDVLEHFDKRDGEATLAECMQRGHYVLLVLPLGDDWPQGDSYGNPFERHLASWTRDEILRCAPLIACEYCDESGRPFLAAVLSEDDPKHLWGKLTAGSSRRIDAGALNASRAGPNRDHAVVSPNRDRQGAGAEDAAPNAGALSFSALPDGRGSGSADIGAPLHIALIAQEYPPMSGGIATYAFNLAHMLSKAGHRVTVFTAARDADEPALPNVNVRCVSLPKPAPTGAWSSDHVCAIQQFAAAVSRRIDLVHAQSPIDVIEVTDYYLDGLFLDPQRWRRRDGVPVPIVTQLHGPQSVVSGFDHVGNAPLLAKLDRAYLCDAPFRKTYSPKMAALCNSNWPGERCAFVPTPFFDHAQSADAEDGGPVRSLPKFAGDDGHGLEVRARQSHANRAAPASAVDFDFDLLYFGRLQRIKGIEPLVTALKLLSLRGVTPRVCLTGGDTLTAPGGGSMAAWARAELSPLYGERLTIQTGIPRDRRGEFLRRARVIVLPSLWESLGFAYLEAFTSGRPVIASQEAGAAYLLPPALARKTLVNCRLSNALVERLLAALAADEAELSQWGGELTDAVRCELEPQRVHDKTDAFYRQCVALAPHRMAIYVERCARRAPLLSTVDDFLRILQARRGEHQRALATSRPVATTSTTVLAPVALQSPTANALAASG